MEFGKCEVKFCISKEKSLRKILLALPEKNHLIPDTEGILFYPFIKTTLSAQDFFSWQSGRE
jgi:hypothetical protein